MRASLMRPTPWLPTVSTAPAIHIWLAVPLPPPLSNASSLRRYGMADSSTSTVPESGVRLGFTIARLSLWSTSQAVFVADTCGDDRNGSGQVSHRKFQGDPGFNQGNAFGQHHLDSLIVLAASRRLAIQ